LLGLIQTLGIIAVNSNSGNNDAGAQYTSIRYTQRLVESGLNPSVGSAGDPC